MARGVTQSRPCEMQASSFCRKTMRLLLMLETSRPTTAMSLPQWLQRVGVQEHFSVSSFASGRQPFRQEAQCHIHAFENV